MGFFEYISNHWYAGAALVLLIILTVFAWIMAAISGRKRNEERERIIAELEKEKALRREFKTIDESTFAEDKDDCRLVMGMCAHIQQKIEKIEDMNGEFEKLSDIEKYVYSLGYVFEDSRNGFSGFFRLNGKPLVPVAVEAVDDVIGGEFAELFKKVYEMLDEDNESVSVDDDALDKLDEAAVEFTAENDAELYAKVASYIRVNKDYFLD